MHGSKSLYSSVIVGNVVGENINIFIVSDEQVSFKV